MALTARSFLRNAILIMTRIVSRHMRMGIVIKVSVQDREVMCCTSQLSHLKKKDKLDVKEEEKRLVAPIFVLLIYSS